MTREDERDMACTNWICSQENGTVIMARNVWRAAVEWADSHPQWIPVEERLPQTIDWYLCYNDLEDGCEVLHWEGDGNVWMDNDWHYKSKEITHWMPIVPPRKEK